MTRRTGWMIGSVVALGAAVGVYAYSRAHRKQPARYETVKADRGRIIARVTATGTLSALVTVQVGSQGSGRIQQLHADFNSPVKKDQVIAKIDPALFQAAVEQARANYVAAQGNLAKAKVQAVDADRQYTRQKALFERKLVAQADLDTSQANADAARAAVAASEGAVEQNRAALHQAQVNLDYTTIKSPINGVVISRNVDVGQTVAASLQAPTLFTIAEDLKKMQVDTNVAEADVGKLAPQMVASFTVDAYPNEKFRGLIRQIRNAPQTVQNVVTYDAVIDVENPDLKLKPGMTANVACIYAEKHDALRVPKAALRSRPPPELLAALAPPGASGAKRPADGRSASGAQPAARTGASQRAPSGALRDGEVERKTVWVLRGSEPKPLKVKTGVSDGTQTEIVEGELAAGDALITEVGGDSGARPPTSGAPAALRRPF